jgi:hypothetical protein
MSRGLEIEIDDERGRSLEQDHRRDALDREVQDRLPKEAVVWRLDRDSISVERELPERDLRDSVDVRGSVYRLRQTEVDSLRDIGRFRVVGEQDLQRFGYAGNSVRMREDIRSLREQGLIELHRIETAENKGLVVFTLTRCGRQAAEAISAPDSQQRYYDGLVKTSEAEHDAALYRLFQAEEGSIRRNGGTVKRVVLDFELKRDVYSYLSKRDNRDKEKYRQRQAIVAAAYNLQVVRGRIQFPDLRVEYEDDRGHAGRVDLELTTTHYRKGQIATKAAAGFKLYSLAGDRSHGGSAVREERGPTADILSL